MAVHLDARHIHSGHVSDIETGVVRVDGGDQLQLRVVGDGPADGRSHPATRPEDPDTHSDPP
jgi:hypothetical protein